MNHLLDWCDGRFDIRSISGIGSRIVCLVQYVLQALQVFVECKFYILDDFQRSLFIIICKGCESSELFGNDCVKFLVRRFFLTNFSGEQCQIQKKICTFARKIISYVTSVYNCTIYI